MSCSGSIGRGYDPAYFVSCRTDSLKTEVSTVITTASLSFAILVAATIPSRQTPRFSTSLTARTAAVEPYSRPRPNGRTCPEPVIRGAKGTIALLRALQPAGSNLKRHRPNAPPQQAARRTPCGTLGASSGTARTACIRAKCVRSSIGDGDRLGPHPLESFSLARRRAACSADGRKVPQKRAAVAALKSSAMVSYIGQIFQITPVPGIWTSEPLPVPTT